MRLEYLTQLSLESGDCSFALLQSFTLPALRSLHLSLQYPYSCSHSQLNPDWHDSFETVHLLPFLTRSRCQIQIMVLKIFCFARQALVPILEACPDLTTLELVGRGAQSVVATPTLMWLSLIPGSPFRVVNLTRIRIDCDSAMVMSKENEILAMLRSRQQPHSVSKLVMEIIISEDDGTNGLLLSWAADMQAKGADVRLYRPVNFESTTRYTYRDRLQDLLLSGILF